VPSRPLSSPRTTRTRSPLVMTSFWRSLFIAWRLWLSRPSPLRCFRTRMSEHLRRERHDLHVPLFAKLARHRSEDARRARLSGVVDNHNRILVEADVAPVLAPRLLHRANDDRLGDVALLHGAVRQRVLDGHDHLVSEPCIAPPRSAEYADHERSLGAGVIGDLDLRFLLDHLAVSSARTIDDLDHAPPLVLRKWAGLHDAHGVPGLGRVLLVVRLQPRRAGHHLLVHRVRDATFDRDHNRLLHLIADADANTRLARVTCRGRLLRPGYFGHDVSGSSPLSAAFWRRPSPPPLRASS